MTWSNIGGRLQSLEQETLGASVEEKPIFTGLFSFSFLIIRETLCKGFSSESELCSDIWIAILEPEGTFDPCRVTFEELGDHEFLLLFSR